MKGQDIFAKGGGHVLQPDAACASAFAHRKPGSAVEPRPTAAGMRLPPLRPFKPVSFGQDQVSLLLGRRVTRCPSRRSQRRGWELCPGRPAPASLCACPGWSGPLRPKRQAARPGSSWGLGAGLGGGGGSAYALEGQAADPGSTGCASGRPPPSGGGDGGVGRGSSSPAWAWRWAPAWWGSGLRAGAAAFLGPSTPAGQSRGPGGARGGGRTPPLTSALGFTLLKAE